MQISTLFKDVSLQHGDQGYHITETKSQLYIVERR